LLERLIDYFDLRPDLEGATSRALGAQDIPWLAQYFALVFGIMAQPYVQAFQTTGEWNSVGWLRRVVPALIIGLILLPGAYRRSFDPNTPGFVQWCTIFVAGMGWQSLLLTAVKAVSKAV
jgi:hypothetical protein